MTTSGPTGTTGSGFQLPSFWKRKEGKIGGRLMVGVGIGLFALFHKPILAFLISLFTSTLHAAALGAAILAIGVLLVNPRSRAAIWGMFQLLPNAVTSLFYTIGAEGYLLDTLRVRREKLRYAMERKDVLKGIANRFFQQAIAKAQEADRELKRAQYAQRRQTDQAISEEERVRLTFQGRLSAGRAGMLKQDEQTYRDLKAQLDRYLSKLTVAIEAGSFLVEMKEMEYKSLIERRHAAQEARSAVESLKALYRGDSRSQLADEMAERMLGEINQDFGEIDGFLESIDGFVTKLDIDRGIYEESALQQIESMSTKVDVLVAKVDRQKHSLPDTGTSTLTVDQPRELTQGGRAGEISSIADLLGDDTNKK